jgi:nucleotide-binding universal stress UspA family protein
MNQTAQQEIVVGVTGSRASVAALRWAADEAGRRGARLSVVCAWDPSLRPAPYANVAEGHHPELGDARAALYGGLAAAISAAFGPVPPAGVDTELAEGMPERVLISRAATADLLVLGAARPRDATGLSVGPVIRTCLSRSQCPVVVVSAGTDPEAGQRPDADRVPALTG